MGISKIVVVCAALAVGSTLTLEAQQGMVTAQARGRGGVGITEPGSAQPTMTRMPLEAKVVKGMPYSADVVTESVQTLGDGNRIVRRSTGRVYRDADGRVRREEDRPSGAPTISITDPIAGTSTILDADRHTAIELPGGNVLLPTEALKAAIELKAVAANKMAAAGGGAGGGRGVGVGVGEGGAGGRGMTVTRGGGAGGAVMTARAGGPAREERTEEALPNRTIEGVVCTGVRRTTTIPAGAIGNDLPIKVVSEEWTSVDLQVLVSTDTNDPRAARSAYQLLHITRANPDASLFKVPGDYTVSKVTGRGRGGEF